MSNHVAEAAAQLHWWLRLPPTNLIDRSDHVRFRHALYLIIHQVATVLYGMNGLPETMFYPSRLENARARLSGLPRTPEGAGRTLTSLASERVPEIAWAAAARLIRDTLALLNVPGRGRDVLDRDIQVGSFKPDRSRGPDELNRFAEEIAGNLRSLRGVHAVALGGSLGRGFADCQSDIDLLVFGPGIPQETDRRGLISAWPDLRCGPVIEQACDSVVLDGAMVHVRYWTSQTVEDMLAGFPTPPRQRILAEALQNGRVLIDPDGRLARWKGALAHIPDETARAVTGAVRGRRPRFRELLHKAVAADDRTHLYCLANQAVNDFLIALYIRNGRFLSTPGWTHKQIPLFDIVPANLETRLSPLVDGIADGREAVRRWALLEDLWNELVGIG